MNSQNITCFAWNLKFESLPGHSFLIKSKKKIDTISRSLVSSLSYHHTFDLVLFFIFVTSNNFDVKQWRNTESDENYEIIALQGVVLIILSHFIPFIMYFPIILWFSHEFRTHMPEKHFSFFEGDFSFQKLENQFYSKTTKKSWKELRTILVKISKLKNFNDWLSLANIIYQKWKR